MVIFKQSKVEEKKNLDKRLFFFLSIIQFIVHLIFSLQIIGFQFQTSKKDNMAPTPKPTHILQRGH